MSRSQFGVKKL